MRRRLGVKHPEDVPPEEESKEGDYSRNDDGVGKVVERTLRNGFEQMWGFPCEDLLSLESFAGAMYRPTDPACLGVVRSLFGFCMLLDVMEERGLSNVDLKWGDPRVCHFPLVHGLRPLDLPWMIVLYATMWLGALGIALGYRFKLACGLFALPYWYLFLLDKSYWNNHSYLYGVVALLMWGTNADRYFSLDSWKLEGRRKEELSVPYWNYFILKFQFFVLYFIAGLKKSSREWLEGYSMTNLSRHWVFEPFKLFMSTEQTDFYVVHWFAFMFDLTVGFFMLLERTRLPAMLFCAAFHLMNSRLFSIGMFPYVCLATMPLFCRVDWPRKLLGNSWLPEKNLRGPEDGARDFSGQEEDEAIERKTLQPPPSPHGNKRKRTAVTRKQRLVAALLVTHVALQFFLPYSHFTTKGYNNWVPGLYGYSWDMMMHAWDTVLVVVRIHDNENQKDHFLDPNAWTPNDRWAKHGDMVWQYAQCIKDNLQKMKGQTRRVREPWVDLSSNLSIYVDVWCSLNGRFQQRLFDPRVDLLRADWHPFKPVSYLMPLLRQFSSYRSELERIQQDVYSWSNYTDVLFVADYPGMGLDNYVDEELANVTLSVLEGEVETLNEAGARTGIVIKGGSVAIETGRFHRVVTTSPHPACYMYTFANRTKQHLDERGIKEERRARQAFPILKEIAGKAEAFGRSLGHIVDALLHLTLGIPMPKSRGAALRGAAANRRA